MHQQHPDSHPQPEQEPQPAPTPYTHSYDGAPDQPYSPQPYARPYGEPFAPAAAGSRHRLRRVIATVAGTALVAGAVGIGAGFAAGHGFGNESSATGASGSQNGSAFNGNGSGSSGTQAIPGNPFGNATPGNPGHGSTSANTTKASGSQLDGLVRVVATMKYAGARAAGTGMVLSSDGEVVTNHHVVEGATSLQVKVMSTGKTYTASVVGTDAKDDVAVLQLANASGLQTVKTDTSGLSVGDNVTAVGDGNGTVGYLSAAAGQVLGLQQSITTRSEGTASGERLTGLTKISSDVVSGFSGGATYDRQGEVVGMTTAASSGSSNIVGYAVPITTVLRVLDDLQNNVASTRYDYGRPAFLGVGLGQGGTTVAGVYQGTPAATAGIVQGDRVTKVDDTTVIGATRLHHLIATHSPGDAVSVTWVDARGTAHTKSVTLVEGPVA